MPVRPISLEAYLDVEAANDVRHAYLDGEVYTLAGASDRHNLIIGSLVAHLRPSARHLGCRVSFQDLKLQVPGPAIYYPDLMVVCDATDSDPLVKHRPCVVAEVTSPSTEGIDRREKLLAYRRLESLRSYVLIAEDERGVEHHLRDQRGAWWRTVVNDTGTLVLPCLDLGLSLDQIHEDLSV